MNRLIIIGNGFDLSHGLKTSFQDFIADYLYNVITEFAEKRVYDDKLISLKYIEGVISHFSNDGVDKSIKVFNKLLEAPNVYVKYNSIFFRNVYKKIDSLNWVDIEVEYYKVLVEYRRSSVGVNKLNAEFDFLRGRLMKYLKIQEENYNGRVYSLKLENSFREPFDFDEILGNYSSKETKPKKVYFLNFNYTNILMKYFERIGGAKDVNYIHGNLIGDKGEPIFGFGDEFDKYYSEIEDLNDNEYFKHIKSFAYSKNQNYFSLMRFINSGDYQVQIYGHSCGLSDRTMLNKIFENEKCKSIKIFYYGDEKNNDFIDKLNNISRHFKDKTLLREKVVPMDMCTPMPQPIEEYKAKVNGY